jgi:hypothetical protein
VEQALRLIEEQPQAYSKIDEQGEMYGATESVSPDKADMMMKLLIEGIYSS